jgi:hypothetical protein
VGTMTVRRDALALRRASRRSSFRHAGLVDVWVLL